MFDLVAASAEGFKIVEAVVVSVFIFVMDIEVSGAGAAFARGFFKLAVGLDAAFPHWVERAADIVSNGIGAVVAEAGAVSGGGLPVRFNLEGFSTELTGEADVLGFVVAGDGRMRLT